MEYSLFILLRNTLYLFSWGLHKEGILPQRKYQMTPPVAVTLLAQANLSLWLWWGISTSNSLGSYYMYLIVYFLTSPAWIHYYAPAQYLGYIESVTPGITSVSPGDTLRSLSQIGDSPVWIHYATSVSPGTTLQDTSSVCQGIYTILHHPLIYLPKTSYRPIATTCLIVALSKLLVWSMGRGYWSIFWTLY